MVILWWLTSLLAILGSILNIRKNYWCFVIWIITNLVWGFVDLINKNPRCLFFFVGIGMCIWGLLKWVKERKTDG
jgi:hypothetical protein